MTTATTMTTATEVTGSSPTTASLYPEVDFPEDPGLRELPKLFDAEWVRWAYQQFGAQNPNPHRIRIRQFSHSLGRTAIVGYEVEWQPDEYIPSEYFGVKVERDEPIELFRYPDDHYLPGLSEAARPDTVHKLLNRYVLAMPHRRARVELIRYRPASRAVLRHSVGRVRFYARVMRPNTVTPLFTAQTLIGQSGFVVPRVAGYWADGGVVWLSEIPGKNLRQRIQVGRLPDPTLLLDGLQTLWNAPHVPDSTRPFNLSGAYRRAKRSFTHNVRDGGPALRSLNDAINSLDPFVRSWRPTSIAHNDFYDDQMSVLPDGRIALVDFEEAGPGDPMLDVGNFLAHLRWVSCFGRKGGRDGSGAFYQQFRDAALDRFRWTERDLAFREAVCLFRMCTNTIRRPQEDWRSKLGAGLSLVNETL